jgi:NAD(P)-dependent dehydrogenase (short-subunit alcohol dehydrogenase family)
MSVFRQGATALITGGSSGIGLAVAQLCLKHGMRVAIADNNSETLRLAKETLSGSAVGGNPDVEAYEADVSEEEEWITLAAKVRDRWTRGGAEVGVPDFLMLNAGVGTRGSWGDSGYFQKVGQVETRVSGWQVGDPGSLLRGWEQTWSWSWADLLHPDLTLMSHRRYSTQTYLA